MITSADMSRLIDDLYAAALGECGWDMPLARLTDLTKGMATTVELHDIVGNCHLFSHSVRLDQSLMPVYVRDFSHRNPRVGHLMRNRSRVAHDHMFMTETDMDADPFYAEFLRPQGLRYFVSADSGLIGGRVRGAIAVQRGGGVRGADDDTVRLMELLAPHIERSLTLFWKRTRSATDPRHFDHAMSTLGLTRAESRMARGLSLGEGVVAYARRTGISVNTAYVHYARIKDKLDCRTQAELALRLRDLR